MAVAYVRTLFRLVRNCGPRGSAEMWYRFIS
jgi:hypothetical protein